MELEPIKAPEVNFATISGTMVFPAIKYLSGDREWIAVTIPYKVLGKFVQTSAVKKKNVEVIKTEIKNRFLDPQHKNEIKSYIAEEPKFTLPPITLVSYDELPFRPYLADETDRNLSTKDLLISRGSIMGLLYLPIDYEFECLDGNHRTVAIRELASENPELIADSNMLLNIVYEKDIWKIRQDFVDVNKNAKQTTASINTLFNTRDAISALVAELLKERKVLNDRTELLSASVPKLSKDIYTINNIRNAVIEVAGFNSQTSSEKKLSEKLKDQDYRQTVLKRIYKFFDSLFENPHIKNCLEEPDKTPEIRNVSLITSGTGLIIASRVAGNIFENYSDLDIEFRLSDLMQYNWSRSNHIFEGKVVTSENKILNSRDAINSTSDAIISALNLAAL